MPNSLEFTRLSKVFDTPKGPALIVKNFDLLIRPGEFVCLIGHSGCGKSTVLSMAAGLLDPTSGGVILAGREIDGAGPDRGVVFQSPCLLPWLTALENVLLGVDQVYFTATKAERREHALHFLSLVGLEGAADKRPSELSQGMRQRVGIARAFAIDPKVLLLDEPFGMLDKLTKLELQDVLLRVWGESGKTALMVTHDVDEAIYLADRVVMMTNGPEAEVGDILEIPFARPRDRHALLEERRYYELREHLISYLEEKAHLKGDKRPLVARGIVQQSDSFAEKIASHAA